MTFAKFGGDCSGEGHNMIWQTNKYYMDIFHPILMENIHLVDVDDAAKVSLSIKIQISHFT